MWNGLANKSKIRRNFKGKQIMKDRFRYKVFDNDDRKMHDVIFLNYENNSVEWYNDNNKKRAAFIEEVPTLQCSGLKDKHGKRIYESDILKFRFGRSYRIGVVKCVSTIWDVSNAQIVQGAFVGGALINCHKNSEVIGNIYENPELLNDNLKRAENLITNPESKILDSIKRAKIKTDISKAIEELFDNE